MKWKGNVQESCQRPGEVGTRSNEVGKEDRGSPDEPQSVSTSPSKSEASERVRGESEVREDFGVTGRGSDAKGVNGREAERKGERNEEEGGGTGGIGENRSVPLQDPVSELTTVSSTPEPGDIHCELQGPYSDGDSDNVEEQHEPTNEPAPEPSNSPDTCCADDASSAGEWNIDEELEETTWRSPACYDHCPGWKELQESINKDLKRKDLPLSKINQLIALRCFSNLRLKGMGWVEASKHVAGTWHEGEGHWFARQLRVLARHYQQLGRLPEEKRGGERKAHTILLDEGVKTAAHNWLASQKVGSITPRLFQEVLNEEILPALHVTTKKPLCERTARRWLVKLGYRRTTVRKGVYMDGHERDDVKEYRDKVFLPAMAKFEARMTKYKLENGQLIAVPPVLAPGEKELIVLFQDESTFHANEYAPSLWLREGKNVLRKKGRGRLIHVSDFVTEVSGRLVLFNANGEIIEDARQIIYPGTNGDAWWDHEQLLAQVKRAIQIFETAHPGCHALFIFDQSSAHASLGPDALHAFEMNKSNGGKQRHQRDTVIPMNNPVVKLRGKPQPMKLPNGQPKGLQQVLEERGFDVKGLKAKCKPVCPFENKGCCMARLLSQQDDFANQTSLLEELIRKAGHECIFLPKFHCELNPIEMYWGWCKYRYRQIPKRTFEDAKQAALQCLNSCPTDGLSGNAAAWAVKKQKGHRTVSQRAMLSIEAVLN
ncbi:hypothetical protein PLEOSDRAFT_164326 [Pleurotus ostreatus PC15]|uniref:Tc1-like transposase DDE domain-containing protein n=1 Tax=Pleurotus ostreatus (strain PC15) TaxID=1137138 RepID=A0A067PCH2_PLEO1|nr:hypothetical protein PLEOSDRAFT_164326 [Pleurotus ostreatus PC15]